jgi:hypothetical protein
MLDNCVVHVTLQAIININKDISRITKIDHVASIIIYFFSFLFIFLSFFLTHPNGIFLFFMLI